jgi:hypothetical protein
MDMKKILQAFDSTTTKKPAVGVNDMKRFVSIIKESSNPYNPVEETVINSFEAGTVGGDANEFLLAADKINDEIMAQVNKIKIHADEANLRDMMDKFNTFMTAYHNVGKEIIQPDMFNDSLGEVSDRTLKNYRQDAHTQVQGAKFGKGKGTPDAEKIIAKREKGMAAAGKRQQARRDAERANYKRPKPAKTSSGPQDWYGQNRYMGDSVEEGSSDFVSDAIEALRSSAPGLKQQDFLDELYMYIENQYGQRAAEMMSNAGQDAYDEWYDDYLDNTEQGVAEGYPKHQDLSGISTDKLKAYLARQGQQSVPGEGSQVKRVQAELQRRSQGVAEGLSFKDYLNLAEAKQKGVDGKACWDGYKRMGTKKKGGKTVDNCVPTGKK